VFEKDVSRKDIKYSPSIGVSLGLTGELGVPCTRNRQ